MGNSQNNDTRNPFQTFSFAKNLGKLPRLTKCRCTLDSKWTHIAFYTLFSIISYHPEPSLFLGLFLVTGTWLKLATSTAPSTASKVGSYLFSFPVIAYIFYCRSLRLQRHTVNSSSHFWRRQCDIRNYFEKVFQQSMYYLCVEGIS